VTHGRARRRPGPGLPGALLLGLACLAPAPEPAAQEIERILSAVIGLRAEVPESAHSAEGLGTQRAGSGVVIDSRGLVLTIGYLVLEARRVYLAPQPGEGPEIAATVLAYDHSTGFGLVRASAPLDVTPIPLGDSDAVAVGTPLIVASYGGPDAARPSLLVDRREFAGYWEYLLENALFASPPHPLFGGAALIAPDGTLVGIGSLIVDDARRGDEAVVGNMFVPINQLKPILGELLTTGRGPGPPRPWLGMHSEEVQGRLFVRRVTEDGPAARAGLVAGTIVTAVNGNAVTTLSALYRTLWAAGGPGTRIRLTVLDADGTLAERVVTAGDRYEYMVPPPR
jgi:S1-C subfamily serine protease